MFILIQLIFFFTFWSIIEDFEFDEETKTYHYPCPCGDRFEITIADLMDGEDIARCPSCSLMVRVIYDPVIVNLKFII
ncbi:CSL zinc finger-domain-containing protein [Rhizophagus diaphanus]|nr:CSL zinc finger-domain-containing protein [Rhizophagus diaphanus] [Rhizophagus sp. MUCL 43196]